MAESNLALPIQARLDERVRPDARPVMYQRWEELLFLHWQVEPERVQQCLPEGLTVDTFDGTAWIGVVPFQMRHVRPRFCPAVPGLSNFPEINLRTYVVDDQGRPGVWFYSLDTPQKIANWIARRFFNLNYRLARFEITKSMETLSYRAELAVERGWDESQDYNWTRLGQPFSAEPGSLEFFLVERYRLFADDPRRGRLRTGQVHHVPYPVQHVKLDSYSKGLFKLNDLPTPNGEPVSALASAGVNVEIFGMEMIP